MRPAGYHNLARAALYTSTAAATGWQVFRIMMLGVWGKPSNPWEFVALFGCLVLLYAAASAYDGAPRSEKLAAVLGCGLLWAFYGPAIDITLSELFSSNVEFETIELMPPLF